MEIVVGSENLYVNSAVKVNGDEGAGDVREEGEEREKSQLF